MVLRRKQKYIQSVRILSDPAACPPGQSAIADTNNPPPTMPSQHTGSHLATGRVHGAHQVRARQALLQAALLDREVALQRLKLRALRGQLAILDGCGGLRLRRRRRPLLRIRLARGQRGLHRALELRGLRQRCARAGRRWLAPECLPPRAR